MRISDKNYAKLQNYLYKQYHSHKAESLSPKSDKVRAYHVKQYRAYDKAITAAEILKHDKKHGKWK